MVFSMCRRPLIIAIVLVSLVSARSWTQTASPGTVDRARAIFAMLVKRDFAAAAATFDDRMLQALPAEKLGQLWTAVVTQTGAFQTIVSARVEARGAFQAVILRASFERADTNFTFVLGTDGRVAGLFLSPADPVPTVSTLPDYINPASFTEQPVTVGSGEFALPGTITRPRGAGPFPAVVLVHGSGQQDRDSTSGPNKPFRDLAHGLASRGILVLRYDKRTRVHAQKTVALPSFTVREETIDDAVLAVELLRQTPGVNGDRVFVLGHSLGGQLVPRIAPLVPAAAGFIVLAGAVRSTEQSLLDQNEYVMRLDGGLSAAEQAQLDQLRTLIARIRALTPDSEGVFLGARAAYWIDMRDYDAPRAAAAITRPMLLLQGGRDYNVTMADFAEWRAAIGGKTTVTMKTYPSLNHIFVAGTGPITPAEYNVAAFMDEEVVRDIAAWMLAR